MNKTIGIFAHVDAGKTTFAEQILYHTKSIKNLGRVDHKDAFLDMHNVEMERGITVFSEQGVFEYNSSTYYLVDTPGHMDFSMEMERSINIVDYAILIISGTHGIQSQTEVIWELLRKNKIPTFIFINKIDIKTADVSSVLDEIRLNLTDDIYLMDDSSFKDGSMDTDLIEFIAEKDENLIEMYLENGYDKELWLKYVQNLIKQNKLFPCFSGSALKDIGIDTFIEKLDSLTFTEYKNDLPFSGIVYKIRHDENMNKITYIKALSGMLNVKQEMRIGKNLNKVNEIRIYNGDKFKTTESISAGELFAVCGLSSSKIGNGVGNLNEDIDYSLAPTLKTKVIIDEKLNAREVLSYFKILEDEDPGLNVSWNEKAKEIQVHIMGVVQLEILKQIVLERFNLEVEFGSCKILYKETILKGSMGYGHFEPLRHYAEVHLKLEPGERGSGIVFNSECSTENLEIGTQNLIRTHIYERKHRGILTGSPLTDLKITLITGRAHIKHTCGGDFREATLRALRQGLEMSENIVLEPYYRFKISADTEYMGKIISDIQKLNGSFRNPDIHDGKVFIKGRGPVSEFMNYNLEFITSTNGRGKINFQFDGYDICHNEEKVIEKVGYNKNADIEYTSASVFCSKGQGFLVPWDKAKEYMHCLK
ncbi:GTP-binding protein [Clostridium fermenticellae]|uniref:GTP-binding protein n=1 Tax=Clostridium fermenticellae TaxID=2068654 RepID=A0A386H359_9CLOT|nr:TetM/TetW/TetO/TetS family tetracycline resistance ribosomal protection protein [Clostridium fermenticellae]AYD40106.1 GTP-binding protein [Clostridium fermenticellae]